VACGSVPVGSQATPPRRWEKKIGRAAAACHRPSKIFAVSANGLGEDRSQKGSGVGRGHGFSCGWPNTLQKPYREMKTVTVFESTVDFHPPKGNDVVNKGALAGEGMLPLKAVEVL